MSKLKQSIAVLRQIPEHVRNNYPMFVEFIKIYYQYLEQTQQQDLESLHDIDKVTDEFIDRFKGELAKNFPINLVSDKRLVLKHLREFYLSRGSEASYKFLFRTLFDKEASLYYPSRQMLRVSDGRWTQDVSIFVKEVGTSTFDFASLIGKIILITNSRGKVIRTAIKNVVKYSEEIYEIFIERDYVNEINVGAIVSDDSQTYKAMVLPCPTSIKVYKGGKGFSAGEIFALKTQLGRGCVIKITKVDSAGSIQRVQVIRFGLDYETKFYSYLSNKDNAAFEYIHPLKIGTGSADSKSYTVTTAGSNTFNVNYVIEVGTPLLLVEVIRNGALVTPTPSYTATNGTSVTIDNLQIGDVVQLYGILTKGTVPGIANPAYNERSGGFVDYGWASKQTYFYYDTDIPIGNESWASDRYFADSAYVGEIVQQFYNDASLKVVDEDIAIIEIDLGSVAKYPGYYSTADGFISDEIYIQDGNYYQAFSYVVRVEEELRRYADIIKALVHPAGMKIFSEYSIFNQLDLQYTQPRSLLSLTLPLYDHPPSNTISDDRGVGYDAYDVVVQGEGVSITPSPSANPVYANQGKASYHTLKRMFDAISTSDYVDNKHVFKLLEDAIVENYIEQQTNDVSWVLKRNYNETISKYLQKPFADTLSQYAEAVEKAVSKALIDAITETETLAAVVEKLMQDSQTSDDTNSKLVEKPFDDILSYTESVSKLFYKNLDDSIIQTETHAKAYEKIFEDSQSQLDDQQKLIEKSITDVVDNFIETLAKEFLKNISESVNQTETLANALEKTIGENQVLIETVSNSFSRQLSDTITERYTETLSSDGIWLIKRSYDETIEKLLEKSVNITASLADLKTLLQNKGVDDTQLTQETLNCYLQKTTDEFQNTLDLLATATSKIFMDSQSTLDELLIVRAKLIDDFTDALADVLSNFTSKVLSENQTVIDSYSNTPEKNTAETINTSMSGKLWLNPFNLEEYSLYSEDYFSYTPLT